MSMGDVVDIAMPRLWTPAGFTADPWRLLAAENPFPDDGGDIIVTPERLAEARGGHRRGRLGTILQPAEPLDAILPFLDRLSLVALAFPAFNDGRSFSKAELLRSRHGFSGQVRATGEVLIDQIAMMLRVGFDAFEIADPVAIRRLGEGRIGGFAWHYQPAADSDGAVARFAWRRLPA